MEWNVSALKIITLEISKYTEKQSFIETLTVNRCPYIVFYIDETQDLNVLKMQQTNHIEFITIVDSHD